MSPNQLALVATLGVALAACANIERSRDLANPQVHGSTLALQVCSNCHGVTGNAVSPNFPNLAGQHAPYLIAQLQGFRSHNRQDPAGFEYMWGLSRSLTDKQVRELAEYYAGQTPLAQPPEADPGRIEAGRQVFESGVAATNVPPCVSCHGARGEGRTQGTTTYPRLAGQHADYLVKQLMVFQRTNERPEGAVMQVVAHGLTPAHMVDVASFLQTLPSR